MQSNSRPIKIWLITGCALVYLMVLVGGITRLTGSGLSITEWKPIMGALPPLNEEHWQEAFTKYKESPQFQKVNFDFTLVDFKAIFWWEYIHRLLGRVIGLVFLLPFLYFIKKKMLSAELIRKCLLIFLLGGLQGALGWFMVKSGLVDDPRVSHFRLAAHLLTAFITFGLIFYVLLDIIYKNKEAITETTSDFWMKQFSLSFFLLLIVQITYGAFTAGLHAGRIYNTFPKMGDDFMPEAVTAMGTFAENMSRNLAGVQFVHRCLAWILLIAGTFLALKIIQSAKLDSQRKGALFLASVLFVQFLLGVLTILFGAPVWLSVLHQTGAFLLFSASVFLLHRMNAASD